MWDFEPAFSLLSAAAAVVIACLFFVRSKTANNTSSGCIPKANVGMMETVAAMSSKDFPWFLIKIARSLNTYVFQIPLPRFRPSIIVGDPDAARAILMDPKSTKPEDVYGGYNNVTGEKSIFSSNGEYWYSRRKGSAHAFSSSHVKRMNAVSLEHIDAWIDSVLSKDEPFDVADEMIGILLSSICKTGFEYKISDDEKEAFIHNLELGLKEFLYKTTINPVRRIFGVLFPGRRKAYKASNENVKFCLKIIDSYRNNKNPTKGTIIDLIVQNEAYANDLERAADVLTFLVGGHDTTAFTCAWILKDLAKNPTEVDRLRKELESQEDFGSSNYLRMVIKEGMRLNPVAAGGSVRSLGRDISLKSRQELPKGSMAIIPFILTLRNHLIFDEPDKFIPSRWENPTKEMNDAFIPFSLGKQNCIGQSLAMSHLNTFIPKIVSKMNLEIVEEGTCDYFLTMKPVGTKLRARKI